MFKVAWFSCEEGLVDNVGIHHLATKTKPVAAFSIGDNPYMNYSPNGWGYNLSAVDKDSTQSDFEDHYEQMMAKPSWISLLANVRDNYMMADDHEWGGDNWDHTLAQSESGGGAIGAVSQAEADTHWDRGNKAAIAITAKYFNNPTNSDAEAVAEAPSEADAAAANYPVKYFRVGYDLDGTVNNTSPHVEFFTLDCISYRDPIADTDNSSKTMLGANQKAWLKAKLLASTAPFKIIVSPKKSYSSASGDNTDTFGAYSTELEEIIDYINTQTITGVLWIAGDKHRPTVCNTSTGGSTNNIDHACVVACPVGVDTNAEPSLTNGTIWVGNYQNYGVLEIEAGKIVVKIVTVNNPQLQRWELMAGSNLLTQEAFKVSI